MTAKRKSVQKLVIAGLGLALLGFFTASNREYSFLAGLAFIGVIILGIIGIIKLRKAEKKESH